MIHMGTSEGSGLLRVPELLAPAGTPDALRAAMAAGADAVYLGLGELNARAANRGFTLGELGRGCALAHARGARVYVALNALVLDGEMARAVSLAGQAREEGADALIVADAGLAREVSRALPGIELHLSTQAGAASAEAVALAARELHVSRVTCARELDLAELASICAAGADIEAFCHGAICVCYSGACGFSAVRRGRSANRGDCTQPCRLSYRLEDASGALLAGGGPRAAIAAPRGEGVRGAKLLCPRDYSSAGHVAELMAAGVAALKVEGRMKNPDYVFNVVRSYRAAIDAVARGEGEPPAAASSLGLSFNRGFTDGYLKARTGAGLMSFDRAINQGLRVGEVVERRHGEVVVALTAPVHEGDVLEIRSTPGADAPADVPERWPQVPCRAGGRAGGRVAVGCKRKVEVGSPVHVVRSSRVLAAARAAVAREAAFEEGLGLTAPDAAGDAAPSGSAAGAAAATAAGPSGPSAPAPEDAAREAEAPAIAVAGSAGEARRLAEAGAAEVAVFEHRIPEEGLGAWARVLPEVTVILDEACRERDLPLVRELCSRAGRAVCRNIGQIDIARACGVPWGAAAPIQVWNAHAARWLASLGAERVFLPADLTRREVAALAARIAGEEPALAVCPRLPGPVELMVCEHCLLTAEGPCAGDATRKAACASCPRRLASRSRDRFLVELEGAAPGARLPVEVDAWGRTRIFNA